MVYYKYETTNINNMKEITKKREYTLPNGYKTNKPTKVLPSKINDQITEYLTFTHTKGNLPTVEGFSLWIGCNSAYLSDRCRTNKVIAKAMQRIKGLQKDKLVNNGLNRSYDSSMSKFLLMNNHGMSEKSESKNENVNITVQAYTPEDTKEWKKTIINGQIIDVKHEEA